MVVVAVLVEAALSPSPAASLEAISELGPLDGWRCAHVATYVYEPRWPRLGGGLLAEPAEGVLPNLDVERVEVDLRTGEAVAWVRLTPETWRVYVLAPGRLQTIGSSCSGHLAAWHVIGEHSLE